MEAVNDLLLSVIERFDEETQAAAITIDRVHELATTHQWAERILHLFLTPIAQAHAKTEFIAMPLMQHITFSLLATRVFLPMTRSLRLVGDASNGHSTYLQNLQDHVFTHGARPVDALVGFSLMLFEQSLRRNMAVGVQSRTTQFVHTTMTRRSPKALPRKFSIASPMPS